MEYVAGDSLRARLAGGPLSADVTTSIGRQLADAVAAAHAQGVIHRDLKPSNVQLTSTGVVKVLDFGVAKVVAPLGQDDGATTTCDESIMRGNPGTPIYMAPEQLIGGEASERSDVYSLGIILFEMATGRRPYTDTDAVALAVAMSTTEAPAADAVNPRVPRALSDVIARALQREPKNRFESAAELAAALSALREPSTGAATSSSASQSGASRGWLGATAILTLAAIGVVGVPLALQEPAREQSPPGGPAVLAVLRIENRAGDMRGDYVGAALASVVATNFGSISQLTVLPTNVTAELRDRPADLVQARAEFGVTHALALTVRAVAPSTVVEATLRRSATGADVWTRTIGGDALSVQLTLLDDLATALTRERVLSPQLSPSEWARARKLPTSSADAMQAFSEGRALLDRYDVPGNVDRAIVLFNRATVLDPQFAVAFAALGEALWKQYTTDMRPERAAAATAAVTKALTLDGEIASVYYALGLMQSQTGRYEEATASLRQALRLQPGSDEIHRLLGRVLSTIGDHHAAVAEVNRAIALRPFWNNYYSLGYVLYASGDYDGARQALKKTTELKPTYPGAYQMLGTVYHMLGDLPQAIGHYEHAVRLGPSPSAHANLGLAYYTAKHYDRARQAYADAIALQPRKATLHKSLGDVYVRLGRMAAARAAYEHAMRLARDDLHVNPRDALAVVLLANCEAKLGRPAEAERHAAEATMLAPKNRDVWIRTAKVYVALADRERAREAVRMAVAFGYEPKMIAVDDELQPLGSTLKPAIEAGVAARAQRGATK
jgi:tetratricopeptide (TPR) repeat protein/TolB-like protein